MFKNFAHILIFSRINFPVIAVSALEMGHLLFFLFESWYHFLPSIWIMVVLCSTLGLVAGIIVVQSPHAVSRNVSPEEKEFAPRPEKVSSRCERGIEYFCVLSRTASSTMASAPKK